MKKCICSGIFFTALLFSVKNAIAVGPNILGESYANQPVGVDGDAASLAAAKNLAGRARNNGPSVTMTAQAYYQKQLSLYQAEQSCREKVAEAFEAQERDGCNNRTEAEYDSALNICAEFVSYGETAITVAFVSKIVSMHVGKNPRVKYAADLIAAGTAYAGSQARIYGGGECITQAEHRLDFDINVTCENEARWEGLTQAQDKCDGIFKP